MTDFLDAITFEFRRHKRLADNAMAQLDDEMFFSAPAPHANSIAVVVKHLAGNLRSRWTDFLTSDGDKPDRIRDNEFILAPDDSRESLMSAWDHAWQAIFSTLESLDQASLEKSITIRGEPHSVPQALIRGLTHAAYHTGQIMYQSRMLNPEAKWLTIAPGQSTTPRPGYFETHSDESRSL